MRSRTAPLKPWGISRNDMHDAPRVYQLNAKLDKHLEFGILESLIGGAALHVGQNALIKTASSSGVGKRALASVFQAGVRHARSGVQLHPGALRFLDMTWGPEYSGIYKAGLKSTRPQRLAAKLAGKAGGNKNISDVADVMTGKRSRWVSRAIEKVQKVPIGSKQSGGIGAAVGGIIGGAVEPFVPAVNATRTFLGESKLGQHILTNRFIKGLSGHKPSRIRGAIEDYMLSPSLNKVQNVGYGGYRKLRQMAGM